MRVLTAAEMQAFDRRAIEVWGVPALVLMENAALGVADAIGARYPQARSVAIFCGPGNNGGDGLAVGRQLATRGCEVALWVLAGEHGLRGDAATQLAIVRRLELNVEELPAALGEEALEACLAAAARADVVVDALFGTGLTRGLAGDWAALVAGINRLAVPRVAVDLPSGLDASRGGLIGPHVRADLTVTFACPKLAHVLAPAAEACGEVVVADLGVPLWLDEEGESVELLEPEDVAACLPPRAADSHKGTYGHLLLVAGGEGHAGAAILAARAAVRTGAGLVSVATPAPLAEVVDLGSLESMTLGLPVGPGRGLAVEAAGALAVGLAGKTALAVGPGLGLATGTQTVVRELALTSELPLLLDADGLTAFAGCLAELAARPAPTVLTPHPGEMGRLLGCTAAEVQADRLAAVRTAARTSGAVVVLKGHRTLVAEPSGAVRVSLTGNPGMASGGSGDVLTGMIGSFLAQGLSAFAAASVGAYLHGLAGDRVAARAGEVGLRAGDLVEEIPRARRSLQDEAR